MEADDTPRAARSTRKVLSAAQKAGDASAERGTPTPRSYRHSSPASRPSTPAKSSKRGRKPKAVSGGRKKGSAAGGSGSATPISRNSRASSVASTAKASVKKSTKKPKIKTKLGRGYNPNLVNYKVTLLILLKTKRNKEFIEVFFCTEPRVFNDLTLSIYVFFFFFQDSEYHYGSDFDEEDFEQGNIL